MSLARGPNLCSWHLRLLKKAVKKFGISKYLFSTHEINTKVCIVGSGPAGFYTAQQVLKGIKNAHVDIYEKLPVPFGLVRYGVAPDHPEVKNVINTFTQTAQNERCFFYGNVEIGRDVSLKQLCDAYSAVVLAYGSEDDRPLRIPGENLENVLSAREFVGWYNGLPQNKDLKVNLDVETAVIVGVGNVALDVARILLTPLTMLMKTDISQHALEALSRSKVKRVVLVGRRGPLQVAFTIKELREMIKLPNSKPILPSNDLAGLGEIIPDLPRPQRRLTELMYKTCVMPTETDQKLWEASSNEWELKFLRSPLEIVGEEKVEGVKLGVNVMEGNKAVLTDAIEEIPCGLVLRSIGYKGRNIDPSLPFDSQSGHVKNLHGSVENLPGVYCSGWIGTGPTGVILTTMTNSFNVGKKIVTDLENGIIPSIEKLGSAAILKHLKEKGIEPVTFAEWEKIDKFETALGSQLGKPREKLCDLAEMLKIAKQ